MSPFFGHNIDGGGGIGGWQDEPKANQKLLLGAESYLTITSKGFFKESQVLLSSIVWNWFRVMKWNSCYLSLQRDGKTFALEMSNNSSVQ